MHGLQLVLQKKNTVLVFLKHHSSSPFSSNAQQGVHGALLLLSASFLALLFLEKDAGLLVFDSNLPLCKKHSNLRL